jgi:hypothetical protein
MDILGLEQKKGGNDRCNGMEEEGTYLKDRWEDWFG